MPLSHLRFTVRRLMIAIAILAVLLLGLRIAQNTQHYRIRLSLYSRLESTDLAFVDRLTERSAQTRKSVAEKVQKQDRVGLANFIVAQWQVESGREDAAIQAARSRALYHARMKAKYQAALRRPWISVEPDPPE